MGTVSWERLLASLDPFGIRGTGRGKRRDGASGIAEELVAAIEIYEVSTRGAGGNEETRSAGSRDGVGRRSPTSTRIC